MKIRIFKFSNFHTFLDFLVLASVHRPSVRPFFVRPPARASGTRVLASQPASRQGKSAIFVDFFVRASVHRPITVRLSVRPFRHGNQPYFHENMKIRIFIFSYIPDFSSGRPSTVRPPSAVRQPARLERGLLASQPAVRDSGFIHPCGRPSTVRPSSVRKPARPPARASVRPSERSSKF